MTNDDPASTARTDRYVYRDGQRYLAGFSKTIPPAGLESNVQFEERMEIMAQRLAALADVRDFELEIKRNKRGAVVECIVRVNFVDLIPAPIVADDRQAGGRSTPRGSRGSGALRLALGGI
jgi:hypothetical protein